MDNNGNGHEDISIAAMIEQAVNEASGQDGKRFANRTFTPLEGKDSGVLRSMMNAIKKTEEYRQELKTANWTDGQAAKAVAAIHERMMCGVSIDPIVDRIIAESAGEHSARLNLIIKGLTHQSFDTNYGNPMEKLKWWKGRDRQQASGNSLS